MRKVSIVILLLLSSVIGGKAQSFPTYLDENKPIEVRVEDALSRMTLAEKIAVLHAQSKFSSVGVKRLGIPDFWTDDGPHGVRAEVIWDEWKQAGQTNDSVVAFPALTCLAATWNPDMAAIYGNNLAEEALYRNKNMMLGPGVNIYRTPLGGRNFEYIGEDPYLASRMVVPYIKNLQAHGVSACVKHFVLNDNESDRHNTNVIVSDRALHEIYLPAFKAAVVEAKTWGLMGAYNLYKNIHNCYNHYLINDLVKGKWHYDGVVVSDWGGTHETEGAITGGLDMEFGSHTDGLAVNTPNAYEKYYLAKAYRDGIVKEKYTEKELNDKVRRILRLFFRTNMNRHKPYGFLCSEAHYAAARKIADDGIVLLKNKDNLLPINPNKVKKLLIVGENAIKMMTVGGGSSALKVQHEVLPLKGLKARLDNRVQIDYARGYVGSTVISQDGLTAGKELQDDRTPETLINEAVEKAKNADCVIFFGGLNKTSHQDSEGSDRLSYNLPYNQDKVVEALVKANKNVVFVCISGNAVAMPWAAKVPAILQGWYLGSEAGTVLADILTGDVNPSGKLPYTWGAKLDDYGAHKLNAFPGVKRADTTVVDEEYKEGIYVGYRWVDKEKVKPLFAFGHGLSYTSFKIGKVTADKKKMTKDGNITFTVNIQNTGKRAGAEVIQLYIHDLKCSLDRPLKELKGFKKVYLQPGESQKVNINIDKSALSFYDDRIQDWNVEPGDFEALVGNASDNIVSKVRFTLK